MIERALLLLSLIAAFALIHSVTAGVATKAKLKWILSDRFVEGWYRLAYNTLSILTLAPSLAVMLLSDGAPVVVVSGPLAWLIRGFQVAGLAGLVWALLSIDWLRFMGLRQVFAYMTNQDLPLQPERLVMRGPYLLSRHPLYLFSLIFLWCSPTPRIDELVFNAGLTLYFVFGSMIEERRLLALYGEEYHEYQRRVAWLIPGVRIFSG